MGSQLNQLLAVTVWSWEVPTAELCRNHIEYRSKKVQKFPLQTQRFSSSLVFHADRSESTVNHLILFLYRTLPGHPISTLMLNEWGRKGCELQLHTALPDDIQSSLQNIQPLLFSLTIPLGHSAAAHVTWQTTKPSHRYITWPSLCQAFSTS